MNDVADKIFAAQCSAPRLARDKLSLLESYPLQTPFSFGNRFPHFVPRARGALSSSVSLGLPTQPASGLSPSAGKRSRRSSVVSLDQHLDVLTSTVTQLTGFYQQKLQQQSVSFATGDQRQYATCWGTGGGCDVGLQCNLQEDEFSAMALGSMLNGQSEAKKKVVDPRAARRGNLTSSLLAETAKSVSLREVLVSSRVRPIHHNNQPSNSDTKAGEAPSSATTPGNSAGSGEKSIKMLEHEVQKAEAFLSGVRGRISEKSLEVLKLEKAQTSIRDLLQKLTVAGAMENHLIISQVLPREDAPTVDPFDFPQEEEEGSQLDGDGGSEIQMKDPLDGTAVPNADATQEAQSTDSNVHASVEQDGAATQAKGEKEGEGASSSCVPAGKEEAPREQPAATATSTPRAGGRFQSQKSATPKNPKTQPSPVAGAFRRSSKTQPKAPTPRATKDHRHTAKKDKEGPVHWPPLAQSSPPVDEVSRQEESRRPSAIAAIGPDATAGPASMAPESEAAPVAAQVVDAQAGGGQTQDGACAPSARGLPSPVGTADDTAGRVADESSARNDRSANSNSPPTPTIPPATVPKTPTTDDAAAPDDVVDGDKHTQHDDHHREEQKENQDLNSSVADRTEEEQEVVASEEESEDDVEARRAAERADLIKRLIAQLDDDEAATPLTRNTEFTPDGQTVAEEKKKGDDDEDATTQNMIMPGGEERNVEHKLNEQGEFSQLPEVSLPSFQFVQAADKFDRSEASATQPPFTQSEEMVGATSPSQLTPRSTTHPGLASRNQVENASPTTRPEDKVPGMVADVRRRASMDVASVGPASVSSRAGVSSQQVAQVAASAKGKPTAVPAGASQKPSHLVPRALKPLSPGKLDSRIRPPSELSNDHFSATQRSAISTASFETHHKVTAPKEKRPKLVDSLLEQVTKLGDRSRELVTAQANGSADLQATVELALRNERTHAEKNDLRLSNELDQMVKERRTAFDQIARDIRTLSSGTPEAMDTLARDLIKNMSASRRSLSEGRGTITASIRLSTIGGPITGLRRDHSLRALEKVDAARLRSRKATLEKGIQTDAVMSSNPKSNEGIFHQQYLAFERNFANLLNAISSILYFHKSAEPDFTCSGCLGLFKDPRLLWPCGHTFCAECMEKMQNNHDESYACTLCGQSSLMGHVLNKVLRDTMSHCLRNLDALDGRYIQHDMETISAGVWTEKQDSKVGREIPQRLDVDRLLLDARHVLDTAAYW